MMAAVLLTTPFAAQTDNQGPTAQVGTALSEMAPRSVDLQSLPQLPQPGVGVKATPPPRSGVPETVYKARKAAVATLPPAGPTAPAAAPASPGNVFLMTPAVSKALEGIDEATCGWWIPSDHALAVGPTYVVQVLNECIGVTDKNGVVQTGFPKSLQTFFGAAGSIFDPRAVWDPYRSRYIITAIDGAKWFIAMSKTSNPVTGGWWIYTIPNTLLGLQSNDFVDFDTLGQDKDVVYAGATIFPAAGGVANRMMFLPKAKMASGQALGTFYYGLNFTYNGLQLDSIQPANHSFSTDYPRAGFLVASLNINYGGGQCVNGCNGLVVFAVSNALYPAGIGVQITTAFVPTTYTYIMPPNALQPGCSDPTALCALDTGDTRISGEVTYAKGLLWGSLNTKRSGNNTATVLWFTLRPYLNDGNAACTGTYLYKCAQITGADILNEDCYFCGGRANNGSEFYGVPVVDAEGNATMVANYSDSVYYPTTYYVSRRVTQAKNSMHDIGLQLALGQGFYYSLDNYSRNRWGDYTAAQIEGNTYFWFGGQYSKLYGGSYIWGTKIGRNAFTARNQP